MSPTIWPDFLIDSQGDPLGKAWLRRTLLGRRLKWAVRRTRKAYYRRFGVHLFRRRLARSTSIRLTIGASSRYDVGWIPTEKEYLNLARPGEWRRFLAPDSVDAMLAEHVWEHLSEDDALTAARTCFSYLRPGGYLRIAVPDGLHPDPEYQAQSKVDGRGPGGGPNDHKVLYTYRTARQLFELAGFRVALYEYFDDNGRFHCHLWDERAGKIRRSKRFDHRNRDGCLGYTSIVLDAVKPERDGTVNETLAVIAGREERAWG
jgi:predicted SAM-dependent methyltransferase